MSTPMRRPNTNQFVEVRAERLEGAPLAERRRWSDDFKERAVAAALAPDVNISALARSLEISPAQLFGCKRPAVAVQLNGLKFQGMSASISLLGQRLAMRCNVSVAQA